MKRVLFDVDGIIADFIEIYLRCLLEACGIKRKREEVTDWDVGDALGLDRVQRAAVHSRLVLPGRAFSMETYPGSVEAVKHYATIADVYFVTSPFPSPTWCYDRDQWLKLHFGDVLGKKVTYTHDKHICSGDIFIDDKPQNVDNWQEANPKGIGILWDQPYNQGEHAGLLRLDDWSDLLEVIAS